MKRLFGGLAFGGVLTALTVSLVWVAIWPEKVPDATKVGTDLVADYGSFDTSGQTVVKAIGVWPSVIRNAQESQLTNSTISPPQGATQTQQELLATFAKRKEADTTLKELTDAIALADPVPSLEAPHFPERFKEYIEWRIEIEKLRTEAEFQARQRNFEECVALCSKWFSRTREKPPGELVTTMTVLWTRATEEVDWENVEEARRESIPSEEQRAMVGKFITDHKHDPSPKYVAKAERRWHELIADIAWERLQARLRILQPREKIVAYDAYLKFVQEHPNSENAGRRVECVAKARELLESIFGDLLPEEFESKKQRIILAATLDEVEGVFEIDRSDPNKLRMLEPEKKPIYRRAILAGPDYVEGHKRAHAYNQERNNTLAQIATLKPEPLTRLAERCDELGFQQHAVNARELSNMVAKCQELAKTPI